MGNSRSTQRRKVEEAKRAWSSVRLATQRDMSQPQAPKFVPTTEAPQHVHVRSEAIAALTLQEAATWLGISTGEMEAMVKRGRVKSVVAGWTTMVPVSEVERLTPNGSSVGFRLGLNLRCSQYA